MNTELERRKQEITRTQGRRKLWQRIVSALAAVVMFVTTYVLILPVEAQNRTFCEKEAHEHSAENGCYVETKTLKCEVKHEHTDECYITLLTLICQHEEHIHNKECYADKTADIETQQDWEASIKAAKLTGEWSKDILAIASTQLGYRESERNYILGENNEIKGYTRYGDWIGDKYTDWSAAFVAFCLNYTGISKDEMTYDKVPEQWAELVKNDELFNENITETNPGDLVFIDENGDNKADKVGIVVEQSEDKIKTVEGDLNNSVAYAEYILGDASAASRTAQANVEFSNENSNNSAAAGTPMGGNENINNKDFSEEKSTTGRTARAEEKPIIIGSVSLPVNPNYNPPITITDPENTPEPTQAQGNRVNPTIAPTTPPEGGENRENSRAPREYIAPEVPVLTGINSTTKVAIIYQHPSTGRRVQQYTTLEQALDGVEQAVAMGASEFTVVFTANYTMTAADHTAMFTNQKGSSATKIYFTSCYNNGTADITSSFAPGNYFIANTETDIYNLTFSGGANIQGGGNKLTIGTGVVGNTSSNIWGGLINSDLDSDTDVSVFSGTWNTIYGGSYRTTGSYTLNGNSKCYIGGTTVADYAIGGGHTAAQTGSTSLTIGGSAKVTSKAFGGAWLGAITGNTSLVIEDDASVVLEAYGGSHQGAITGNTSVEHRGTGSIAWVIGGSNQSQVNGNTSAIVGGSVNVTSVALGGSYKHTIYGNTSLLVTDDAVVNQAYGGSYGYMIYGDEINLTINGRAKVNSYAFASGYATTKGKLTVSISEQANVADLYSANQANIQADSQIIYNIDGTDGATVRNIYLYPYYSGSVAASVDTNITIKNMKDISNIDGISNNSGGTINYGSGTITIIGDVQVQRATYANANTDLVLEENATLQCGANAALDVAPNSQTYGGYILFHKSLIMKQGSRLIMASNSVYNGDSVTHRQIKDIDVQGPGCEIDVFKQGTTNLPIRVNGEKKGTDKLKLGIFSHPLLPATITGYGETLLTFATAANAKAEDYLPGENVENLYKSGGNIVTCLNLPDRIDMSVGHVVVGEDYDLSDPNNPILHTVQYVGDTETVYAMDHALAPSYTFTGTNRDMSNWVHSKIRVMPNKDIDVELVLDNVDLVGNGRPCVLVTNSNTTITLVGENKMFSSTRNSSGAGSAQTGAGAIAKNGMTHELTIRCEFMRNHPDPNDPAGKAHRCGSSCGSLDIDCSQGAHVCGIGAEDVEARIHYGVTVIEDIGEPYLGAANIFIIGGNISVLSASHTAAIGSMCGCEHVTLSGYRISGTSIGDASHWAAYLSQAESATSQSANGQGAKNIRISHARVYAKAGNGCAGIGSGYGGWAEDIYITDGAYVYAEGGLDSPGIGSGGRENAAPYSAIMPWTQYFRNFVVSGGETVVECVGGQSNARSTGWNPYAVISDDPDLMISGIGVGPSWWFGIPQSQFEEIRQRLYDAYAIPDSGYVAIVKQGTPDRINYNTDAARASAEFLPGAPSTDRLEVSGDRFYTLIYFSKIEKTASVNGAAEDTGTQNDPVMVNVGDTVKYTIRTGEIADSNGAVTGSLVDVLPEGMTFSGSGATPAAGFSYSYDNSTKRYTVRWDNVDFSTAHEFSVNVTVNNLPTGVNEKTFENQAVLVHSDGTNEIPLNSNWTYHKVVRQAPPEFDLTIEKTVVGAGTGPFSFTVTFTDGTGAAVNIPQPAANSGYTVAGNVASFDLNKDGSVTITGIPVDTVATIVETSHNGYTVQYNFSDGTPSVSGDTASVTITDDLTVTCINNAGFELPHTGGTGSLILTLGGVILVATALMYGISLKRRQWRAWI